MTRSRKHLPQIFSHGSMPARHQPFFLCHRLLPKHRFNDIPVAQRRIKSDLSSIHPPFFKEPDTLRERITDKIENSRGFPEVTKIILMIKNREMVFGEVFAQRRLELFRRSCLRPQIQEIAEEIYP